MLFEFGSFRLDPKQRELSRGGELIALTPKAFDTLLLLVERRGQLVSKTDMLSALWPDTAVEEGNLAWHVSAVRKGLSDDSNTTYIETVPKFGYRFVADVRETPGGSSAVVDVPPPSSSTAVRHSATRGRGRYGLYVAALLLLAVGSAAIVYLRSPTPILAERDWILIANVDNRTGQPAFDDVLTDSLEVQFDQSPYFRVFSRDRIDDQLELMRRQRGERVTESIAREICERAGVKAYVAGSVVRVGSDYVVTLSALNGRTGDALSRNQQTVAEANGVLRAIGAAATSLRGGLGESLQSLDRFDASPEMATTASLPALRAFREGQRLLAADQSPEAVAFFQRAIELDPDFAIGYARLGLAFANINDRPKAEWAAREAFLRRDRVSERERHEIDAKYYRDSSGEVSKAVEAMELGARLFPDDARAQNLLQIYLRDIGRIKDAVTYGERAAKLNPHSPTYRMNLIGSYIRVGDLAAAKAARDAAERDGLDTPSTRRMFRLLAVVADDQVAIDREEAWRKEHRADAISDFAASQAGVSGRLSAAQSEYRDLIRRLEARGRVGLATTFLTRLVTLESLLDPTAAAASARELLSRDSSRQEAAEAAVALAIANGDVSHIRSLAGRYEQDQLLNRLWLPMSQAIVDIHSGFPARAVPLLRAMDAYDLGDLAAMRPSYFLGEAHLALGDAPSARAAFEKIIHNRGVVSANPLFAMAHLGLARAEAIAKRPAEAAAAYERFFEIWKDADERLPIMKAARTEYARLK